MQNKKNINETEFAIWGTGDRSSSFSKELSKMPVCYIDNDITKKGTTFFNRKVCHPSEIEDWGKFYIVIANSFYEEIRLQLQEKGLKEEVDFIYYGKIQNNKIKLKRLIDELQASMSRFKEEYKTYQQQTLIFGSMISFDKNSCTNFNQAYQAVEAETQFLMISETHAIEERAKEGKINFPYFCLPLMLWQNYHLTQSSYSRLEVTREIADYINNEEYRINAVQDFEGKNKDIAEGYASLFIYYADRYLRELFDFILPKRVCIWNQFYPFHCLIGAICKEKGIDLIYMEYGGLPGTYLIERTGQMGESAPAVHWKEFQKLEVDEGDIEKANEIYTFLKTSGINRKEQPENSELENAKSIIKKDWPIIVYTGQNDYESGMYPYTDKAKKYHSPIFSGSNEAAYYLAELAEQNNWNFIYKPHPLCLGEGVEEVRRKLPKNAILIERCNINDLVEWADLNITILSTTAYVSLIREKPVLMLGYTQLYKKGCTYEAFARDEIEAVIIEAVKAGYTQNQRKAFVEHVARLVKYYAYDDLSERPIRYGKDWRRLFAGEKIEF